MTADAETQAQPETSTDDAETSTADADAETSTQSEPASASHAPASTSARRASSGSAAAQPTDPVTRQALVLLVSLFVVTFLCWGAAHVACNRRIPQQFAMSPQSLDMVRLDPKGTAILAQQRAAEQDYDAALKFAGGEFADELKAKKAECAAKPGGCKNLDNVVTTALIVQIQKMFATAHVTTMAAGQESKFEVKLEREENRWAAVSRASL